MCGGAYPKDGEVRAEVAEGEGLGLGNGLVERDCKLEVARAFKDVVDFLSVWEFDGGDVVCSGVALLFDVCEEVLRCGKICWLEGVCVLVVVAEENLSFGCYVDFLRVEEAVPTSALRHWGAFRLVGLSAVSAGAN